MESKEIVLCTECEKCPVIGVDAEDERVTFREGNDQFTLTKDAWNTLVNLIEAGKLGKL